MYRLTGPLWRIIVRLGIISGAATPQATSQRTRRRLPDRPLSPARPSHVRRHSPAADHRRSRSPLRRCSPAAHNPFDYVSLDELVDGSSGWMVLLTLIFFMAVHREKTSILLSRSCTIGSETVSSSSKLLSRCFSSSSLEPEPLFLIGA